jgi:hypothetical protein
MKVFIIPSRLHQFPYQKILNVQEVRFLNLVKLDSLLVSEGSCTWLEWSKAEMCPVKMTNGYGALITRCLKKRVPAD